MKMNRIEKFLMNSGVRAAFQRWVEAPILLRLGGPVEGGNVLEVGCGRGVGTELILTLFGAKSVHAFDLDPDMVRRARRRFVGWDPNRVTLEEGDATAIRFPDGKFDAVFDFAALHHVQNWELALGEIRRVLKPGGAFYFEEVTRQWLNRWPYRVLFDHPKENRFSAEEFRAALERQGFGPGIPWTERKGGDFVFGVARVAKASLGPTGPVRQGRRP
jgi:ubiquinone/menaquinone biosynthesis C-methylase UbiE